MLKKNEEGLSLIELLAVIVILSIISILVISITTSATKQNDRQVNESNQIQSAAYVLKLITKDLRNTKDISGLNEEFTLKISDTEKIIYKEEGGRLFRNGNEIGKNVKDFSIILSGNEAEVSFKLNNELYETIITLRKGDF